MRVSLLFNRVAFESVCFGCFGVAADSDATAAKCQNPSVPLVDLSKPEDLVEGRT